MTTDVRVAEEARVIMQINSAAQRLHALWSVRPEDHDRLRWRAQIADVQADLDRLYERRRELQATAKLPEDQRVRRAAERTGLAAAA